MSQEILEGLFAVRLGAVGQLGLANPSVFRAGFSCLFTIDMVLTESLHRCGIVVVEV
jgi:hypothetical protein